MSRRPLSAVRLAVLAILGVVFPASSAVLEPVPRIGVSPAYGAYSGPAALAAPAFAGAPAALAAPAAFPTLAAPPAARRDESVVDDYFGAKISDPYRWLEDPNSEETKAWVAAQDARTRAALARLPGRAAIVERLKELLDYERESIPSRMGDDWVFQRNSGLQNQDVLYKSKSLRRKPQVLLDPNGFSPDGTVSLAGLSFSDGGKLMAYALSRGGTDWIEWRVRDVKSGRDLPDVLRWADGSSSWAPDGSGFYYKRYAQPKPGQEYTAAKRGPNVYFHRLGTPQEADELNLGHLTDGHYLAVAQYEGAKSRSQVFVKDLKKNGSQFRPLFDGFGYTIVHVDGDVFYLKTAAGAPRGRLVAVDIRDPRPENWKEIIPQPAGRDVLEKVVRIKGGYAAVIVRDARHLLKFYDDGGAFKSEAVLPGAGTIAAVKPDGGRGAYVEYSSYLRPPAVFHADAATGKLLESRSAATSFDPAKYEVEEAFYPSKDGTKIHMFIAHKKGMKLDGTNPTYLSGYGGFNRSMTPSYSSEIASWLEMGGVYAVANLRGGGEYGEEWHDAGRLGDKQNVFDDFIAAAEYLIREKYASPAKLAIGGGSNGGLLVGAALTQRPDLFGAAIPEVGVHDMLRFHLYTAGAGWKPDYGSSETKEGFDTLYKYSPLHNVKPGTSYPPTLIMTADRDDRVVPAHSHKFAAALQAAQAGPAPILERVEAGAGHGQGTPLSKMIEKTADKWAFLRNALGVDESSTFPQ